ncbi:hypothetical protein TRP8649_02467 [Pelagimonas phthalicica]|uniref:Lipoprotein n=1 Tax=Pelagimonas phthalicica TaxID=1037362 RepID=A0A238JCE7_9RHOB|nr:hypothetical protein [Pelagimonas phthalicica]TDS91300.1 hypothetical protein CLV87_2468 [Pelagimonas phthalicica]SMX28348.1 hypothetical protein TRP8649_02467 [Pelagimonas phthalicica]
MKKPISVLVVSMLVLTSCGAVRDSVVNPFNWFGRSKSEPVATEANVNPLIPKRRASLFRKEKDESYKGWEIAEVTQLLVERRPGGAIVRASGVTAQQNAFDVKLVPVKEQSNETTLTFAFKALQARGPVGSEASRTVTAAIWLTDNQLAGIRQIRVVAANNARVSRR